MNRSGAARLAACLAVLAGTLVGPVTGASASDASIKQVVSEYNPKILASERQVESALAVYKTTGEPDGVKTALTGAIAVLASLKSKIAAQSAASPRVKQGRAKLLKGLGEVIVGYGHLRTAVGESTAAARAEAVEASREIITGSRELAQGFRLLR
jgi:hypothetical protein